MALRFFTGFDAYTNNDLGRLWDAPGVGGYPSNGFVTGRFGGRAMRNDDPSRGVIKIFDAQPTWTIGFALYFSHFTSGSPGNDVINLISVRDGGSNQISLLLVAGNVGNLYIERGTPTTLATTTTVPLSTGRWYYLEFKVTIHDTTGSAQVRLDGVVNSELNLTNVDTKNTANASADRIVIGSRSTFFTNTSYYIDDLYINDGTGSAPKNGYFGDVVVPSSLPNGNGNASQLLGSDANSTDNYLLTDDTSPDDDTTYVESSTVTNKDTYTYQNLAAASGTVYGVNVLPLARKTDAGARSIRTLARLSGTEIDNGTDLVLGSSYAYHDTMYETKPGGGDWTVSDINNAEFGVKVVA